MPELPEVETVRRGLAPRIEGHRVESIAVSDPRLVARSPLPPTATLAGSKVEVLRRRGKWLLGDLDSGLTLVLHMRMSGRLLLGRADTRTSAATGPARATLVFDDGTTVRFVDQRRFGELLVLDADDTVALESRIGPDADTLGTAQLRDAVAGRSRPVKSALTDQALVGGIGNMYADESLWGARLAPFRPCSSLTDAELRALARAVRRIMRDAIAAGGTSTRDGLYVDASGNAGWFAVELAVYQREGQPCPRCGSEIVRVVRGSTATRFCPACQI
ncbi:MAG: bifunctional DNA-formamidopyrimidine glycosylase/DNA-(apurinic or apyrimidinic site) lyase [Acidimicrobiia bacterium]